MLLILHMPSLPARGMALFPFILIKDKSDAANQRLLNHERIHLRQQLEMLVLPFYVFYLGEYAWHRLRGLPHKAAYFAISFEKEAYDREYDFGYLRRRAFWGFWPYLKPFDPQRGS